MSGGVTHLPHVLCGRGPSPGSSPRSIQVASSRSGKGSRSKHAKVKRIKNSKINFSGAGAVRARGCGGCRGCAVRSFGCGGWRLRLPGVDRPDLGLDLLAGHRPVKGRRRKGARSRLPRSHLPPHPRHTSGRSHSWQNRNRRRFHSDGGGDVTPSTSRQEPGEPGPTRSQVIGSLERAANNVR